MSNLIRKTRRFNGKKYEAYGHTDREATKKLYDKIAAAERGEDVSGGGMKLDKWFEMWMDTYKRPSGIQEASLKAIEARYNKWLHPSLGHRRLKDIRDVHLQKAINELQGCSHGLAVKVLALVKALFRQARISRMIPYDPAEALTLPGTVKGHRRSLTDDERAAMLDVAATHKHGLWIQTLLYTGMRPGETAALRWSAVDFEHNEIHVTSARQTGTQQTKGPKTEAGVRDIPIHAELRRLMMPLRGEPFALVFPNRKGEVPTNSTMLAWWRSFTAAVDKAHPGVLGEDLTAYCLRHTFCTDLQKAGVPINVAKDLMGHSSIQMTADIYTHRDQGTLHKGMALLDGTENGQDATSEVVGKPVGR